MKGVKKFRCTLDRFAKPHLWDYHLKVPLEIASYFFKDTARRVICSINGNKGFQTGIMPNGADVYFIKINQQIRKSHKIESGDLVDVTLVADESEYGFSLPSEFEELMLQDAAGAEYFQQLTPGKQRSLIYLVDKIKSPDIRILKSVIIFEHLKEQQGKLDFKILHTAFKQS